MLSLGSRASFGHLEVGLSRAFVWLGIVGLKEGTNPRIRKNHHGMNIRHDWRLATGVLCLSARIHIILYHLQRHHPETSRTSPVRELIQIFDISFWMFNENSHWPSGMAPQVPTYHLYHSETSQTSPENIRWPLGKKSWFFTSRFFFVRKTNFDTP